MTDMDYDRKLFDKLSKDNFKLFSKHPNFEKLWAKLYL